MALTDNLLAFYKLSDLTDSSGNNRTLTNNGNVSFASGKIGNAAVFDGSNYLYTTDSSAFSNLGAGDFTMNFWVKPTQISGSQTIYFQNQTGTSVAPIWIALSDSNSILAGASIASNNLNAWSFGPENGQTSLGLDVWSNIIVRSQNGNIQFFLNGSVEVEFNGVGALASTTEQMNIGVYRDTEAGQAFFNGQIDAVGIWNRALSDSEVAALYNSGTGLELDGGNGGGGGGNPTLVKMQAPIKFFGKVKFGV